MAVQASGVPNAAYHSHAGLLGVPPEVPTGRDVPGRGRGGPGTPCLFSDVRSPVPALLEGWARELLWTAVLGPFS